MLSPEGLETLTSIRSWVKGEEEGHIFQMGSPSQ